jgi:Rod binding domain-containing protein
MAFETLATPPLRLTQADPTATPAQLTAIDGAAEDFEALFLAQMLAPLFEGLESDGPFGGGPAEGIYRGLLVEEFGRTLARAGGIGLAEPLQREMLKLQEAASS